MLISDVVYLRELEDENEIIQGDKKIPKVIKKSIIWFKKIFCIVTLKEDGIGILPYYKIVNRYQTTLIMKLLLKLKVQVVLSRYLETTILKENCKENKIEIYDGSNLFFYLIKETIEYIARMRNEERQKQEVTILIDQYDTRYERIIIDLAKSVKRIQIVTGKIRLIKKLEEKLEQLGISIFISNNKRKSLAKANIILNFDYTEDLLEEFSLNASAIIINLNGMVTIKSKAFNGINVHDYEIRYDGYEEIKKRFNPNAIYESKMLNKKEEERKQLFEQDHVKIVNLIGKNGYIHSKEYQRF